MAKIKDKRRVPQEIQTPFDACETPQEHRQELLEHLRTAMILEHATIPPYLCALYSIKDGTNPEAVARIRSVAVEEMLHMALVANLTNAIGGSPSIAHDKFIPTYPTFLPMSDNSVTVSLNHFSQDALQVFLDIERPMDQDAIPKHENYSSIGQFYAAIKDELDYFSRTFDEELFIGDPALQVDETAYYSGGGEIIKVTDYESARRAIKVIVDEGEGFGHSIFSGDHEQFDEEMDLAHFYKFNEIAVGRNYLPTDSPADDPSGPQLAVDFTGNSVYPAVFHKRVMDYPEPIRDALEKFNRTYSNLLRALENGFNEKQPNSKSQYFEDAVALMYEVKYQMISLMKTPIDDQGNTAGPTFIYVDE